MNQNCFIKSIMRFFTFLHVVGMVMMECPARGKELSWDRNRDDQQLVSGIKNKKKS